MSNDHELLRGALDMLILDVVSRGPTYGYAIARTVRIRSGEHFLLKEGSLYPALHKLERKKLLASYWDQAEGERRRKFYRLTPAGKKMLDAKRSAWAEFQAAMKGVLGDARGLATGH